MTTGYESMDMTIDSKEELNDILQKIYCIEDRFEGMNSWVGTILSDGETRGVLAVLADDSMEHRESLEYLISRIGGLNQKRSV